MNNAYKLFNENDLSKLGEPIWERLFLTSMNFKDTLTSDHIRMFGMPTVGDASIDNDMHNQVTDRYLTIDQMVEYHKQGISVSIRNHKETEDIYNIVSKYLLCWKEHLDNGINIGGAPLVDLVALDRFATSVYDHAVEHITDSWIDSKLFQYIGKRKVGRAAFDKKVEEPVVDGKVKQRESLATLFSERVFSVRGSQWK